MIPEKKYSVIIVAGGKGLRAGGDVPKQFQFIAGKPMLMHTIEAFHDFDYRMRIIVVLPNEFRDLWQNMCEMYDFEIPCILVNGGETRFHSVKNGLSVVSEEETVGIHDGARPFVIKEVIERCFETSFQESVGVIPVTDEVNTVRRVTESGSKVIDRNLLKLVQTPQVFPAAQLKKAYDAAYDESFTDDASVAEAAGLEIRMVEGDAWNIKITTPRDFQVAELLYQLSERLQNNSI